VLDANPLDDIRNTQKIAAVMMNGRYFSRADLQKLLQKVEASAKQDPIPSPTAAQTNSIF
jgi:hypothetical protein